MNRIAWILTALAMLGGLVFVGASTSVATAWLCFISITLLAGLLVWVTLKGPPVTAVIKEYITEHKWVFLAATVSAYLGALAGHREALDRPGREQLERQQQASALRQQELLTQANISRETEERHRQQQLIDQARQQREQRITDAERQFNDLTPTQHITAARAALADGYHANDRVGGNYLLAERHLRAIPASSSAMTEATQLFEEIANRHARERAISQALADQITRERTAQIEQERQERCAIERANRLASRGVRCGDGTVSPTCTCGNIVSGCCSRHGGPAGCLPIEEPCPAQRGTH